MAHGIGPVGSASAVLSVWEHVSDAESLTNAAVRTAVFLSHVNDVPGEVVIAIDSLANGFCVSGDGIRAIVRHLQELARLEEFLTG